MVALTIGWLLLHEPLDAVVAAAVLVILAGVTMRRIRRAPAPDCLTAGTTTGFQRASNERFESPTKKPSIAVLGASSGFAAAPNVTNSGARCSTVGWA